MIAGAPVPLLRNARWAQLHHSKWNICPDKHMAVSAGSDKRIYEIGIVYIVTISSASDDAESCRKYQFSVFHNRVISFA